MVEISALVAAYSFVVGFMGSLAYFTAMYFRFIAGSRLDRIIMFSSFRKCRDDGSHVVSRRKVVWYCALGGAVALVFQLPEPTFVPIQALILGVTWPSIIIHLLSGRMAEPTQQERNDLAQLDRVAKIMPTNDLDAKTLQKIKQFWKKPKGGKKNE